MKQKDSLQYIQDKVSQLLQKKSNQCWIADLSRVGGIILPYYSTIHKGHIDIDCNKDNFLIVCTLYLNRPEMQG